MYDAPESPPVQPEAGPAFTETDEQHVRILSIFYFVFAGLLLLGVCAAIFYIVLGNLFLSGQIAPDDRSMKESDAQFIGWMMIAFGGGFAIFMLVWAVLNVIAGMSLRSQRRLILCYVVAGIDCMSIPFGTLLGVFTFIVLARNSVQARFRAVRAARERGSEIVM
jgi:hypothetical protein